MWWQKPVSEVAINDLQSSLSRAYQEGEKAGRLDELSRLRKLVNSMVNNAYGHHIRPAEFNHVLALIRKRDQELRGER